jgi:hypothetical protein
MINANKTYICKKKWQDVLITGNKYRIMRAGTAYYEMCPKDWNFIYPTLGIMEHEFFEYFYQHPLLNTKIKIL